MTSTARITPSSPASPRAGRYLDLLGPRPPVSNERLRHILIGYEHGEGRAGLSMKMAARPRSRRYGPVEESGGVKSDGVGPIGVFTCSKGICDTYLGLVTLIRLATLLKSRSQH